jgi:hypothetical protein
LKDIQNELAAATFFPTPEDDVLMIADKTDAVNAVDIDPENLNHSSLSQNMYNDENETSGSITCSDEVSNLKEMLKNLRRENELLSENNETWTSKLQEQIQQLNSENQFLKKSNECFKKLHDIAVNENEELVEKQKTKSKKIYTQDEAVAQFKKIAGNLLTNTQLKLLLMAVWDVEDISRAFALRYFSHQAYTYLRDELNYPLPALATLRKWAAKFKIRGKLF